MQDLPPPLLADTCKRLKIEQEILQFIEALGNTPTSRIARPDLQLLVLSSLPSWPDSHAIRVIDSDNRVIQQYPDRNLPNDKVLLVKRVTMKTPGCWTPLSPTTR